MLWKLRGGGRVGAKYCKKKARSKKRCRLSWLTNSALVAYAYTSSNFSPLRYNESITLVLFKIIHTVAFVMEVLHELDTVNVEIDVLK